MIKTKVLQVWMGILFCSVNGLLGLALDCSDHDPTGAQCSISVEKLLDRAIQHAELIYRIADEARALFEELFIPLPMSPDQGHGSNSCMFTLVHVPTAKIEIQQLSDKWLLRSILIVIQFWIDPLADLQDSLDRHENTPSSLISKTRWMSAKLMNLKQGVLVLMSKMLSEENLEQENNENVAHHIVAPAMADNMWDYTLLSCFKKDAHKIETFLKLLRCRQTSNLSCSLF